MAGVTHLIVPSPGRTGRCKQCVSCCAGTEKSSAYSLITSSEDAQIIRPFILSRVPLTLLLDVSIGSKCIHIHVIPYVVSQSITNPLVTDAVSLPHSSRLNGHLSYCNCGRNWEHCRVYHLYGSPGQLRYVNFRESKNIWTWDLSLRILRGRGVRGRGSLEIALAYLEAPT